MGWAGQCVVGYGRAPPTPSSSEPLSPQAKAAMEGARAEGRASARAEARAELRVETESARAAGAAAARGEAARAVAAKEGEWEAFKSKAVAQLKALHCEKGQLAEQLRLLNASAKAAAVAAAAEASASKDAQEGCGV